jgi:hypothetical protein
MGGIFGGYSTVCTFGIQFGCSFWIVFFDGALILCLGGWEIIQRGSNLEDYVSRACGEESRQYTCWGFFPLDPLFP